MLSNHRQPKYPQNLPTTSRLSPLTTGEITEESGRAASVSSELGRACVVHDRSGWRRTGATAEASSSPGFRTTRVYPWTRWEAGLDVSTTPRGKLISIYGRRWCMQCTRDYFWCGLGGTRATLIRRHLEGPNLDRSRWGRKNIAEQYLNLN